MTAQVKPSSGLDGAGLLIVDKPSGMTSHDVVSRVRKLFNTRKVGHAGTLDPMATGVLVLGIERATKMLGLLALTTKSYSATIRLGVATTTDDAEGEVSRISSTGAVANDVIVHEISLLTGEIDQVPSSVSAIKVDGQRAHKLIRAGVDVEIPSRRVTVSRFEILDIRRGVDTIDIDVEVDCSSGTYIRALARDLGIALEVGGHLTALRRTRVGPFALEHARTLELLADNPLVSLGIDDAAKTAFAHRAISDDEAESISQGRWLDPVGMDGVYAAIDPRGRAIALLQEKGRRASSVMVVRPATLQ
ncbi:MAG: tRNA pseudouridine(55) synthase TruB [Mycobacteriaceae bacterium]